MLVREKELYFEGKGGLALHGHMVSTIGLFKVYATRAPLHARSTPQLGKRPAVYRQRVDSGAAAWERTGHCDVTVKQGLLGAGTGQTAPRQHE